MFTTNLDTFKLQEKELHRQAVQYRLAKSFRPNPIRLLPGSLHPSAGG